MITKNNIKEILLTVSPETIRRELSKDSNYLLIELHIFNAGHIVSISSCDYDYDTEKTANDSGNLFIDKDIFLELAKELKLNINYY